jgi:hypothetical protein
MRWMKATDAATELIVRLNMELAWTIVATVVGFNETNAMPVRGAGNADRRDIPRERLGRLTISRRMRV